MEDNTLSRDGLLTTDEAAALLGTSCWYLYKLVYQKELHPRRFLGRILFRRDDLEQYAWDHPGLGQRTLSLALL